MTIISSFRNLSASTFGFSSETRRLGESWRKSKKPNAAPLGLQAGIVKDDQDPENMGRLKVFVFNYSDARKSVNSEGSSLNDSSEETWVLLSPIFPFAGSSDGTERDSGGFSQSYGMWFQPRIGDHVALMFADADAADGYYLGCIPKWGQNRQIPGAPAARTTHDMFAVPVSERPYGTPPGGYNSNYTISKNLVEAGLQNDIFRGGSTSGATRESPSKVLGIKSPGNAALSQIGHQFVMDDSDEFQGVRLRTSSGHQLYFSDAGKHIYLSTARGETWIELSQDGHIDIYGSKSISLHAEEDFNITAGRDVNIQADRDLNILTKENMRMSIDGDKDEIIEGASRTKVTAEHHLKAESIAMDSATSYDLLSGEDIRISTNSTLHLRATADLRQHADGNIHTQADADTAIAASEASRVFMFEQYGPPTRSNILNAEHGEKIDYLSGRDENFRVPQHEPWPMKNSADLSPQTYVSPWPTNSTSPLFHNIVFIPDDGVRQVLDYEDNVNWSLVNRVLMNTSGHRVLSGVHPDIIKVIELASRITMQPFFVAEGLRTLAMQDDNVRRGASRTRNSRHLFGLAVDIWPVDAWGSGRSKHRPEDYVKIRDAMYEARDRLGVPIEWGYAMWGWDLAHWQLPHKQYPNTSNPDFPPPGWSSSGWI